MVWVQGFNPPIIEGVVRRAVTMGLPVSILDDQSTPDFRVRLTGLERTAYFGMAQSSRCGEAVARYLTRLGHRRVAFISPFHRHAWSRTRLEGVQTAIGQVSGARVDAYVSQEASPLAGSMERVRQVQRSVEIVLRREADEPEVLPGGVRSRIADVMARLEKLRETGGVRLYGGLLESALAAGGTTAWIAVNDLTAVECIRFLAARGVDVPSRISVVGFDDTLDASLSNLTSYNFNGTAVVSAMLSHLLSPPSLPRAQRGRVVELEGFVSVRATSAAPAQGLLSGR